MNTNKTEILKTFSVLCVEDDATVRHELAQFLERRVKQLYLAGDGAEGLAMFKEYAPDIVVTDIMMPNMNGLDMAKAIKSISPDVPIIVSTAFNNSDYFLRAIELGISKYVLKPIKIRQFIEAVNDVAQLLSVQRESRISSTVFNASAEGIIVTDRFNAIISVNPAFTAITGYTPSEIVGKNPNILSSGRQDKAFYQAMWMALKTEHRWAGEIWNCRKNGEIYPEWLTISVVVDENNNPLHHVAILSDMTERKRNEQILRDAKLAAEEATRVKSDFLANMSHEIRTPMNAIIGMSYLVLKSDLTNKQRDYLKKIQNSSEHLLGIINDVLDFSKIEAGKLTIEHADFEFARVLDNVTNLIASKAQEKGLELIFDLDKNLPRFFNGDSLRLGQILINYANNAIKFTEHGEIVISAKVLEETENDVFLRFGVRDTGIGLTSEQTEKLFQSFQQADTSTQRKYGGTGLGLAIAKQLAELMGGEVGVDSEIGLGSTFWFTARLGKVHDDAVISFQSPDLRGLRVLVVDDNHTARQVLEDLLICLSFNVTQVESGKHALNAIQNAANSGQPYEVVYLDWQMPDMDGIETAKAIQQLPLSEPPHLIMMTAYGRDEVLKEIDNAGFEGLLIKPISASVLFDTTMHALRGDGNKETLYVRNDTAVLENLGTIYGASILVVEDNLLNQEVALGLLENFNVDVANDGQEAIEMVTEKPYDIVLMDMQMPVMDGVSATIAIRKHTAFNNLPIIAMTANAMQHDKEKCLAAGMNDHVTKPIDPEELFRTLLKWIKPRTNEALPVKKVNVIVESHDVELPTIAGLDCELGMKRVIGKKTLYLKMLRSYIENQENIAVKLRAALAANDYKTAEIITHSAKGVSGNIGASGLQEMAGELEEMILNGANRETLEPKIVAFETDQSALVAALKKAFTVEKSNQVANALDADKAKKVLHQLKALLDDDDGEVGEVWDNYTDLFRGTLGMNTFTQVDKAIKNYDFEKALALLNERNTF